jgi:hypothetical protein
MTYYLIIDIEDNIKASEIIARNDSFKAINEIKEYWQEKHPFLKYRILTEVKQ